MKKVKKLATFLLVFLMVFSFVSCAKEKEVVVMDEMLSWGYYSSYQEALNEADLVLVGTVKGIGEAYRYDFELHPYEGKTTIYPAYYTPIEIKVDELIKGNYITSTVTYQALGGEIDNVIYDYRATCTLDIEVGAQILVFLRLNSSEIGYESISPGCVIIEDEKGRAVQNIKGGNTNESIETMVDNIKLAKSLMEKVN